MIVRSWLRSRSPAAFKLKFPLWKSSLHRSHGSADLKLPFSLFLALRYLKPKRTFVSIITLISVLGVTLGVTVLILVISVMTGFDRELRQKGDRLRRAHSRHDRRRHAQLARSHGENPQHAGRGRDRALHPGAGDRRIPESPARADDSRDRSGRGRKGHSAAEIHQTRQARSRRRLDRARDRAGAQT